MRKIVFSSPRIAVLPKTKNNTGTFLLQKTPINISTKLNFSHNFQEKNVKPRFAQKIFQELKPGMVSSDASEKSKAEELLKEFAGDLKSLPLLDQKEIFKNACYKGEPEIVPYIAGKLLSYCENVSINEIFQWVIESNESKAIGSLLSTDYFKTFMLDSSKKKLEFQELVMKAIDVNRNDMLEYILKYSGIILQILDENLNKKSSKSKECLDALFFAIEKENDEAINLFLKYVFFEEEQKQEVLERAKELYGQEHMYVKYLCAAFNEPFWIKEHRQPEKVTDYYPRPTL